MQGRQYTQSPLFVDGDLEKFVPKNHLLRKVNKLINLGFIHDLTQSYYAGKGRPSLDPVVFFKMQLISYLFGISSDRKLCDEIQCNIAYRWYLGYPLDQSTPTHSTLTRVRDRLGVEIYKEVFDKIIKDCLEAGLVDGHQIITDATLVKANASKESMVPKNGETNSITNEINEAKSNKKPSLGKNKTHISKTDPDSTCVNRKGYGNGNLFYKAHYSIDGKSRIILDCHITTGATHETLDYIERLDVVSESFDIEIKECLADSGYGDGANYEELKDRGIRAYIPLKTKRTGLGKYAPPKDFQYDRKNDRYKCPMNKYLYPHKTSNRFTRYVIKNDECYQCPLKSTCISKDAVRTRSKRIQRSDFQDLFDQIRRRQRTKLFQKRRAERSWKVEGIFGEAKTLHNLDRAKYRGLDKMQIQAYMSAISQNIKRIVNSYPQISHTRLKPMIEYYMQKIEAIIASVQIQFYLVGF